MVYKWHRDEQNPENIKKTKLELYADREERLEVRREVGQFLKTIACFEQGDIDIRTAVEIALLEHLGAMLDPDPILKEKRIKNQLDDTRAETKARRDYWKEGVKPSDRPKPEPDRGPERDR